MKITNRIHSPHDVGRMLHDTVCYYDGRPHYVTATGADDTVCLLDLTSDRRETRIIDHCDEKFDYSTKKLGYFFYDHTCYYIQRSPARQWKLGTPFQVLRTHPDGLPFPRTLYATKQFASCLLGKHMSVEDALAIIDSRRADKVPFSREFAFQRKRNTVTILYKDIPVAFVLDRKGGINARINPGSSSSVVMMALANDGIKGINLC